MPVISRRAGTGVRIGRHVYVSLVSMNDGVATLSVEAPARLAVSHGGRPMSEHLEAQFDRDRDNRSGEDDRRITTYVLQPGYAVLIGRGVSVCFTGPNSDMPEQAEFVIEAPKFAAVSRDDFTLESHLEFQEWRERGGARSPI